MFSKLSDIVPFIEEGKVPYPIIVALHVKNRFQSSDFHGNQMIVALRKSFQAPKLRSLSTSLDKFECHRKN